MGVAVGISLLSCIKAKISLILYLLPVYGLYMECLTSAYTTLAGTKDIGLAIGMSLLSCIDAKITYVFYSLPVYDRILNYLVMSASVNMDKDHEFMQLKHYIIMMIFLFIHISYIRSRD